MRFICYCIIFISFTCFAESELENLSENEGYVLLPLIISGMVPESITLKEDKFFGHSYIAENLELGENFKLITLPAGDYTWTKIKINHNYYFDLDKQGFSLTVKKGVINYGGHLIVDINQMFETAKYNYVNRSSQAIDELQNCCVNLISDYSLIFSGGTEDPFIDFLSNASMKGEN